MTLREAELSAALAASQQENARLRQEVVLLQQKIDALVRRIFGSKSEQLNPAQLELLLTGNEDLLPPPPPGKGDASPAASTAGDTLEASPADHTLRPAKPARRPRLPEHLPIVGELIDPPEVLADPGAFRRIGEERTAQLDYTPGRFFQRHTVRGKYVRKGDPEAPPVIAPLTILQDAASPRPLFSPTSSSLNIATTSRFTGWRKSSKHGTTFLFRVKPWSAGWPWPRFGSAASAAKSPAPCWTAATFKLMSRPQGDSQPDILKPAGKRPSNTLIPATAKPAPVTSGPCTVPAAAPSSTGPPPAAPTPLKS